MALPNVQHTMLGQKVIKLMDDYKARMSTPSNDRQENMERIRMFAEHRQHGGASAPEYGHDNGD